MNKLIENSLLGIAATVFLAIAPASLSAQNPRATPPPPPPVARPEPARRPAPYPDPPTYGASERSIKVDSSVNLTLGCVIDGKVKVNGWSRNEVRVFIQNGNKFAFRILENNLKTDAPVWIKVLAVDGKSRYGPATDCLSGGNIIIDAPVNATITVKGREISTTIDSVKKVDIESIGGDVSLRNIGSGIRVTSHQGDITVESSEGAMNLNTTTGNILVFDGGPSEVGDVFKANTNSGAVALQDLKHRQVNVDSISGSVSYTGNILMGGSYSMRTSKGSLRLAIPASSSFQMWATYAFGDCSSELPIDISTENVTPGPIKSIRGKLGKGDATLKLTTTNGSISIRKL